MSKAEFRPFTLHPAIIRSIIREQAGSLEKAFSELIMNSVDAGASRIDITWDGEGSFCIRDDGRGFGSRLEIESFFEKFGTPHDAGDARFGRFRIGRGQIMTFARTTWVSGNFEMRVDLGSSDDAKASTEDNCFLGYELTEHETFEQGCKISGSLYSMAGTYGLFSYETDTVNSRLGKMLRHVDVPIFVNDVMINTPPSGIEWDAEDDFAFYKFCRKEPQLSIYNQGVFVDNLSPWNFGTGGVVCSKQAIGLNMARNTMMAHCPVWRHIQAKIHDQFSNQITSNKVKRLTPEETATLLKGLTNGEKILSEEEAEKLRDTRFIPDIFGVIRTPNEMLTVDNFTLYDDYHCSIAERVQKGGHACVLMPDMFRGLRLRDDPELLKKVLGALLNALRIHVPRARITGFSWYVENFMDTGSIIKDEELDAEELAVMKIMKKLNKDVAQLVWGGRVKPRTIYCGVSETMNAWTDGASYICISRNQLKNLRYMDAGGGITTALSLMIHEYCHDDGSLGDHDHDHGFFLRFHESIMNCGFGNLILKFLPIYTKVLVEQKIVPPSGIRRFAMAMADHSDGLRYRYNAERAAMSMFNRAVKLVCSHGNLEVIKRDASGNPAEIKVVQRLGTYLSIDEPKWIRSGDSIKEGETTK